MVSMITDRGVVRNLNEDCAKYLETKEYSIYVVADGMGGHNAGEVASEMAASGIVNYIKENFTTSEDINLLKRAIEKVNKDIFEYSLSKKELSGMGTTITACLVLNDVTVVANVGDSSSFGIKEDKIVKITKDHSLVQELVDIGSITESQAANHPRKNIITRAVGIGNNVNVDTFKIDKDKYDYFLLCSDGLTNEVSKDDIIKTIKNESGLKSICNRLIELAKENGGRDNITVLLFGGEK